MERPRGRGTAARGTRMARDEPYGLDDEEDTAPVAPVALPVKKPHPIAWLWWTILLPLLCTAAIVLVLLQIFGFDPFGRAWQAALHEARHAPVIGRYIPTSAATAHKNKASPAMKRAQTALAALHHQLALANARDALLTHTVAGLEAQTKRLHAQLARDVAALHARHVRLTAVQAAQNRIAAQASVLTQMGPNQAALILKYQPLKNQVALLRVMSAANQAAILAAMTPKAAAAILKASG